MQATNAHARSAIKEGGASVLFGTFCIGCAEYCASKTFFAIVNSSHLRASDMKMLENGEKRLKVRRLGEVHKLRPFADVHLQTPRLVSKWERGSYLGSCRMCNEG